MKRPAYGPRIYVASLADYNAGELHGVWIDDCTDEDIMRDEIAAMLRESKHPNVQVECVACHGDGRRSGTSEHPSEACANCAGRGTVPSAEEYAIHDHEGFGGINIGEHTALADIAKHAEMIEEHGAAWAAYVGHVGEHYATADGFQDAYRGEADSPAAWVEDRANDCGMVPDGPLASYIDWERYARDMEYDGYAFVPNQSGGVFVFGPG